MKIEKIDEMVKNAFDSINGPMLIWISSKLQNATTVSDLDELSNNMPCERINFLQIVKQIDIIPLTSKEYEKYYNYADAAVKKANNELSATRDRARGMIEDKFKEILENNYFFYDGKNKDKIFDILYKQAYTEGHSEGYRKISTEFLKLSKLFSEVFKAMKYRTPPFMQDLGD